MEFSPAPTPSAALLSLPEAAEASAVPAAAIRRYAEQNLLAPTTVAGADDYHFSPALLPVLITVRIMELAGYSRTQIHDVSTTLAAAASSSQHEDEETRRQWVARLRLFQVRLLEMGPTTPRADEVAGLLPRPGH